MSGSDQGEVYYEVMSARLDAERDRRTTLETRGTTVVTSSAALVSLGLLLTALVAGKDYRFQSGASVLVLIALGLFVLAGGAALMAGQLHKYKVPTDETLKSCLDEHWTDTAVSARLAAAWMNLETILSLRSGNDKKAWWLNWALRFQVFAIMALAVAAVWEIGVNAN